MRLARCCWVHADRQALPHLRAAAKLAPDNVQVWEALGAAELRADDPAAGLAALNRAIELGSRVGLVWNNRAVLRQRAEHAPGDFVSSTDVASFARDAADFRKAIEFDSRCEAAYAGLAGVVYAVQPFDPADVARLDRGRALFPENVTIAVGRAAARLHTMQAAEGERGLRALLAREELAAPARRLAESALEGERLKAIGAAIQTLTKERRFAELGEKLDRALADDSLSRPNRQQLERVRRQTDELRRIDEAVQAYNAGNRRRAAELVHSVLDDPPADWTVRAEANRLLKMAEAAPAE